MVETDTASDISSDDGEDYDDDDVDSEELEEEFLIPDAPTHELSQQSDFVKF